MAEYWYNTSFHSSLQKTPFQALYGYPPPNVGEFALPGFLDQDSSTSPSERLLCALPLADELGPAGSPAEEKP